MPIRGLVFVLIASMLGGCASTEYRPIKSARVSYTTDGYVRDGVTYGKSFGGLMDAVKDNPRAHRKAKDASNLFTGGVACAGFGFGAELGGLILMAGGTKVDEETQEVTTTPALPIGLGVFAAGIALSVASIVLLSNSNAHAFDAMNVYNDDVELKRAAPPPPSALGPRIDAVPSETPPANETPPVNEAPAH